jgi:protein-S-isoprenylcysteine O-methyltransferase Ste14
MEYLSDNLSAGHRAVYGREGEHRMMVATITQNRLTTVKAIAFTIVVIAPTFAIFLISEDGLTLSSLAVAAIAFLAICVSAGMLGMLVQMTLEDRILAISMQDGATRRLSDDEFNEKYGLSARWTGDADAY